MKRFKLNFIILCIFLLIVLIISSINFDVEVIPFDIVIGDTIGFNLNPDKLHFGVIPSGATANRDIYLNADRELKIKIVVRGVDFVHPSVNNFILMPNEQKNITMIAAPVEAKPGLYEGEIRVYSRNL